MDCRRTWELAKGFYDGLEEEHCQYFFKYPCWGQPVTCFTVVSMESLKRLPFSLALLGLSWKGEGFKHHQYVKKSLCLCHFILQIWRTVCQAQIGSRAPLSRPYFLSPPCPPLQCATIALMRWVWSTQTIDEGSAGSPGPCAGALRQGPQGCHGFTWPIPPTSPGTFHLLKNLWSFLFLYWNNYSASTK